MLVPAQRSHPLPEGEIRLSKVRILISNYRHRDNLSGFSALALAGTGQQALVLSSDSRWENSSIGSIAGKRDTTSMKIENLHGLICGHLWLNCLFQRPAKGSLDFPVARDFRKRTRRSRVGQGIQASSAVRAFAAHQESASLFVIVLRRSKLQPMSALRYLYASQGNHFPRSTT
jgi:hypothetical protein